MTAYCGISPVGSMNICRHIEIRASTISAFRFIAQKSAGSFPNQRFYILFLFIFLLPTYGNVKPRLPYHWQMN